MEDKKYREPNLTRGFFNAVVEAEKKARGITPAMSKPEGGSRNTGEKAKQVAKRRTGSKIAKASRKRNRS